MNVDEGVVHGFGDEWERFDQSSLASRERQALFDQYFRVFPWATISEDAVGIDVGCGSGRWAMEVAPRVGKLYCVDPSAKALGVARRNLSGFPNVILMNCGAHEIPLQEASVDFAYSLGVLHHTPDTEMAIADIARLLKPGAPLLLYLYYRFDNRPWWYQRIWRMTELLRGAISRQPFRLRYHVSQAAAALLYAPTILLGRGLRRIGALPGNFPLTYYLDRSWYIVRNDALDRFGTQLEQRFTLQEISEMLGTAGLGDLVVSEEAPFWCVVGFKRDIGPETTRLKGPEERLG